MPLEVPDNIWLPLSVASGGLALLGGAFKWSAALIQNVKATESTARHALAEKTQVVTLAIEKRLDRFQDEYAKKAELRETETRIGAAITELRSDIRQVQKDLAAQSDRTGSNLSSIGREIAALTAMIGARMPKEHSGD